MRFAKHLKHVAVVVLHIGQNSDWHKLTRHETELQSASDFADQKRKTLPGVLRAVLITKSKITDRDRHILLLREKGLWASEIAAVLDMKVSSIHDRYRLRKIGLSIPPASGLRPNANRKVSDEEIIALARSRLTVQEIAAKVGISKKNVHARLKALRTES